MNRYMSLLALAAALVLSFRADAGDSSASAETSQEKIRHEDHFKSEKEKNGYAVGAACANTLRRQFVVGEDVEAADVLRGFKEAMSDKASLSEDEVLDVYNEVVLKLSTPEHWKKMNKVFLEENAKKPGVKTTESGLQYKVLTEGNGDIPKASDAVNVFYSGRFINGVEFDSTARRNSPVNLPVTGGMPKGWTEALQMMKSGSKWRLFIPAGLGYGSVNKAGIWPDSTLIFDVDLVDIGPSKNRPQGQSQAQSAPSARQADTNQNQANQTLSK